jgi:hypothetical protein
MFRLSKMELFKTSIYYKIDKEEMMYRLILDIQPDEITLKDFKRKLINPNFKYYFQFPDDHYGYVTLS